MSRSSFFFDKLGKWMAFASLLIDGAQWFSQMSSAKQTKPLFAKK
jgi:hypothetical protein